MPDAQQATSSPTAKDNQKFPALLRAAAAADLIAIAALSAGAAVAWTGGGIWRVAGLRISATSAWRFVVIAAVVLAIRHAVIRRPGTFALLVRSARAPLPGGEQALFAAAPRSWTARAASGAVLTFAFAALVAGLTWPQIASLYSVPDPGDPLFSVWRIAWVAHQLPRDPLGLFHANIFHPERLTLAYSDSLLVPALLCAPLFWLGFHPLPIYNLLFLSGFVLSGVATFLLVRALTGSASAALLAGAIFAVYPYRIEHYSHLELQMSMWMPLALWGLHRTLDSGRLRDGLATGLAFALQTLSSLYYGLFLAVYMLALGAVLWLGRRFPLRPLRALAAGAVLAGAIVAPVAAQYLAAKPMMGDRDLGTIEFYSAQGPDYLKPHERNLIYARWSRGGRPERQLFPRFTPLVLSAVALCPPLSVARIGYALALVVAVDGSFGFNGYVFSWLHEHVAPYRGLRVPARFSLLAGLSLAILSGYGIKRLAGAGTSARSIVVTAAALGAVAVEAVPHIRLQPIWREPPAIYRSIEGKPPAVIAAFPMPASIYESSEDARYLYFSTWHWQNLVNGNSGFFPPSYFELLNRERSFPSDSAIEYLKQRGVDYIALHGAFFLHDRYRTAVAALDLRTDVELVAAAPWGRREARLYRLRRDGPDGPSPARP